MPRAAERRVTPQPAMTQLMALIAAMRPDWEDDQITAELAGHPWSLHLAGMWKCAHGLPGTPPPAGRTSEKKTGATRTAGRAKNRGMSRVISLSV